MTAKHTTTMNDLWGKISDYFQPQITELSLFAIWEVETGHYVLHFPREPTGPDGKCRGVWLFDCIDIQDNMHLFDPFVVAMVATALSTADKRWDAAAIEEAVHEAARTYCSRIYRRVPQDPEHNHLTNREARERYIASALARVYPMFFVSKDGAAQKRDNPALPAPGVKALSGVSNLDFQMKHMCDDETMSAMIQSAGNIARMLAAITKNPKFIRRAEPGDTTIAAQVAVLRTIERQLLDVYVSSERDKGAPVVEPARPDRKPAGSRW